jgi:hypothetical protein
VYLLKLKKFKIDSPWQQALSRLEKFCCAPFFFFLFVCGPGKTFAARPVFSNDRATEAKNA